MPLIIIQPDKPAPFTLSKAPIASYKVETTVVEGIDKLILAMWIEAYNLQDLRLMLLDTDYTIYWVSGDSLSPVQREQLELARDILKHELSDIFD